MPEVSIDFSPAQIVSIQERMRGLESEIPKALAGAVNDTTKNVRTRISSRIREKFNIKKSDLDPSIFIGQRATPARPSSGVRLFKKARPGLAAFGARLTSAGVTYQIERGGGKRLIPHAFGPAGYKSQGIAKLGHQVFVRTGQFAVPSRGTYKGRTTHRAGKRSGPAGSQLIREVIAGPKRGASAWGLFLKTGMLPETVKEADELLQKNMEHRMRYLILKANGGIANQTP